ncbi:FeoB-associated Cys-rich membrane protein [Ureibacillus sp. FSL K6-8385]|uniref:FeoB-associated Cys-rich membrane protein n=1 Tax=Ureibacillus terrenus TaxID=118246 RepID=A0A540V4V0_9BACL|nr:FeoB-associated Cys-rich membrane protein [Ureibacillus terrenus]MED3661535.1 FeoB-associated Cys-rich membrane protein [Ureibacillus terrenus]MED3764003.1 FeoB-associated Cys-rich membrane protein [Ureibacillus terrenus]TQE91779.1 FeoB-associated Cys-rich membrane protein [Ureibacillus terrenus]
MIVSIILGVIIFGYAFWALYSSIKKSKKGVCASCEIAESCKGNCTTSRRK